MAIEKPVYEDDDSVDEQIRSSAAARAANRTEPTVTADEESESRTMPTRPGQATSGAAKKAPTVTKEELAASGLSLRDYLNKQQGLTRRGESSPAASTKAPARSGQDSSTYSNEGRGKSAPAKYETAYDRMNRENRASGKDFDSLVTGVKNRIANAGDSGQDRLLKDTRPRGGMNAKTLLPTRMAKGGSVSSASKRADGIATKGKTRGTMVMCGGGMTKR